MENDQQIICHEGRPKGVYRVQDIRQFIKNNTLVFDGGMGTYFSEKTRQVGSGCELANLSQGDLILGIHREYLEAGAKAIKTNTFAANRITFLGDEDITRRVITAGWELANKAVGEELADAYVFADIGPVGNLPESSRPERINDITGESTPLHAASDGFVGNQNRKGLTSTNSVIDIMKEENPGEADIKSDIGLPTGTLQNHTASSEADKQENELYASGELSQDDGTAGDEYRFVTDIFIELGAKNFLFETNANFDGLHDTAAYIKKKVPDAYIIVSFAATPDGFTRDGIYIADLMQEAVNDPAIDAFGLNCVCGARHMRELAGEISKMLAEPGDSADDGTATDAGSGSITLSMMPNAGYPVVINNRTFYGGDPVYFGMQVAALAGEGVSIVGGCCGTTPAHIAEINKALEIHSGQVVTAHSAGDKTAYTIEKKKAEDLTESSFWKKLKAHERVTAVELDPPLSVNMEKFMSGAWELKGCGADIITIADCPVARARMDASLLACKVKRELNIDVLPHMTCRDRNLNATQALLMGIYAEGIRNVLIVTGDPIPTSERDEVKSVYQFNSRKLAGFITALNKKTLPSPFHAFGALNVNALNFDMQLRLALQKEEKGIVGFLTQPVLTPKALENLKKARRELSGYILGGVIPVVSERNARFMNSEISGIRVDEKIIDMYTGKSRGECEELAVDISKKVMNDIEPYTDGTYLITPFGRTGLIKKILE